MTQDNLREIDPGPADPINILTPWLPLPGEDAATLHEAIRPNEERHRMFKQLAIELMALNYPWLLRLLQASGGQVLAGHGQLFVAVPANSDNWIEIPELSAQLWLLPWAEVGQTAQ